MQKLVLNLSMLGSKPTGLGVYSEHAARALSNHFNVGLIGGQGVLPSGEVLVEAPESVAIGSGKLAAIRRQLWMRSISFDSNTLVYSPTHHGLPCVEDQIITIHDLICLRYPMQHKTQYLYFKFGLPRLLKKCRAVFCVSETTKADVAKTYGFPEEKIFVIPNGVNASTFSAAPASHDCDPYLLMVGARYPHKNVDEVLEMSDLWSKKYRLLVTSCTGSYRQQLKKLVVSKGLQGRVKFLDYLTQDLLIRLYQGSSALVYPSKWEGFGIPPLEALACGIPIIASDIPVHREVLGSSAFFVELSSKDSWANAFNSLSSEAAVNNCLEAGKLVLNRFTWENSAEKLVHSILAVEPALKEQLY